MRQLHRLVATLVAIAVVLVALNAGLLTKHASASSVACDPVKAVFIDRGESFAKADFVGKLADANLKLKLSFDDDQTVPESEQASCCSSNCTSVFSLAAPAPSSTTFETPLIWELPAQSFAEAILAGLKRPPRATALI